LEDFILTGKTDASELHVFSRDNEFSMISNWARLGFDATYRSQQIDYMGHRLTIKYLNVRNPNTGVNISLIPWFMLPGRRYLIFVYIYAIWHYFAKGKKSLKETAAATAKLFSINGFNKSTVSRSIKAMEGFIDVSGIDRRLSAAGQGTPDGQAPEDADGRVAEILTGFPSVESFEKAYGSTVNHLPDAVNSRATVDTVLGGVPIGHSEIIKRGEPGGRKAHDGRRRPPRPRRAGSGRVQRPLEFVGYPQRERIRKEFIEICKYIVLDAAATYHQFLI